MVHGFESSLLLCFGEHGRREVAFPLCAVFEHCGCQRVKRKSGEGREKFVSFGCLGGRICVCRLVKDGENRLVEWLVGVDDASAACVLGALRRD